MSAPQPTADETVAPLTEAQGRSGDNTGNSARSADAVRAVVRESGDPRALRADGRPRGRPWVKGQSGGGKGRPKSVRDAARRLVGVNGEKALGMLWRTAVNPLTGERMRHEVLKTLLSYACGLPKQELEHSTGKGELRVTFGGRFREDGAFQADPNVLQRLDFNNGMQPLEIGLVTPADVAVARDRDDDDRIVPVADDRVPGVNVGGLAPVVESELDEEDDDGAASEWTLVEQSKTEGE